MIKENDMDKLKQLKKSIETEINNKFEQVTKEVGDIDVEAQIMGTENRKSDFEVKAQEVINEHVTNKEVKPKRVRRTTEDIVQGLLDAHYVKIEELIKAEMDNYSYRIYNSFKAELRRQLLGGNR